MVKFDKSELEIKREVAQPFGPPTKLFSTPITPKENRMLLYSGKTPMWAPFTGGETNGWRAWCDPENIARSNPEGGRGIDGYGIEWVFVPSAGGAMVKPGNPTVTDISEWEKCVTIPNPDEWDWEATKKQAEESRDPELMDVVNVPGCLFERLIACMDYEGAVVALIDEDQKEDVHRFFRAVTEVHKKTYSNIKKYMNPQVVNFNDDWGTQKAQAFSTETYKEMILPYVKEIADHVHSLGMYFDLHSCGVIEPFIPYIAELWDSWGGQPLNDKVKLKELYGDKMIFTIHMSMDPNATEEEVDAWVEEFIKGPGADNRCLVEVREGPASLKAKIYEASRKNYDRLVEEGKAIL
ncbi:MAG: hypothetical protein IKM61_10365 [Eubacteriaceae bacterium]|nr:hypothetical protein [Eubacteriaceae bacterium]